MRKHDVRKWLHAILDLLPVILIPVFMIYSHRHDVTERTDVEVTYKYQSNEVNSYDDLVEGNIYQFNTNEYYIDDILLQNEYLFFELLTNLDIVGSDLSLDGTMSNNILVPNKYYLFEQNNVGDLLIKQYSYIDFQNYDYDIAYFYDGLFNSNCIIRYYSTNKTFAINTFFEYTDYNVIESVEINDINSDIMSVFMDDFNNSIDKYFNMGNVFNLNGVYEWFNNNIFSGNSPTIIYSIWNIALYELVMDLLFLLYGLFMWFIDMVQTLMDKPFKSIK